MNKYISYKPTSKAIGYCHLSKHKGFITKEALKAHDCLGKQCPFLQIYEDKPYWSNYFNNLKRKKVRKYYIKNKDYLYYEQGISLDEFLEDVKKFYGGSWKQVPIKEGTQSIDLSLFIEEYLYKIKC